MEAFYVGIVVLILFCWDCSAGMNRLRLWCLDCCPQAVMLLSLCCDCYAEIVILILLCCDIDDCLKSSVGCSTADFLKSGLGWDIVDHLGLGYGKPNNEFIAKKGKRFQGVRDSVWGGGGRRTEEKEGAKKRQTFTRGWDIKNDPKIKQKWTCIKIMWKMT